MNILEDHANTLREALDDLVGLDEPLRAARGIDRGVVSLRGKLLAGGEWRFGRRGAAPDG